MKTKGRKENFRVVVEPRSLGDFGSIMVGASFIYGHGPRARDNYDRDMESRCNDIAEAVRRHADNVDSVSVEFDQEDVCEHCGYPWTEGESTYNGGCCERDEEGAPAESQETA